MNSRYTPWIFSSVVLLTGALITAQLSWHASQEDTDKLRSAFQTSTNIVANNIRSRLERYVMVMRGLKGFYEGSEQISVKEFHDYVDTLHLQDKSDLQALGLVTLVHHTEKDWHIAELRQQGLKNYQIKPEGIRELYTPIIRLEPAIANNITALGFDIWTVPAARQALEQSRDLNNIAITSRLKLIQDADKPDAISFVMYLPLYQKNTLIDTLEARRAAIIGWIDLPFRLNEFMNELQIEFDPDIDLEIHDGAPLTDYSRIYHSDGISSAVRLAEGMLQTTCLIEIGGHQWTLLANTTPEFMGRIMAGNRSRWLALMGSLVTLVLSGIVWQLINRRQSAEVRYQQLFENASDGIVVLTRDLVLTNVNRATLQLLGCSRQECLRSKLFDHLSMNQSSIDFLKTGLNFQDECWQKRQDGSVFLAEIDGHVLDSGHLFIFLRDITTRKNAEKRIERLTRLYKTLSETNQAIVRMEDESELFPKVCQFAVDFGGLKMAWVGQIDRNNAKINPVAKHGCGLDYLSGLDILANADLPTGRGPTGTAFRENHPVIINDYLNDPITEPWRILALKYSWRSAAAFPMQRGGKPFAVLNVYCDETDAFDEEIIGLLVEMAKDISFALDNFDRETQRRKLNKQLNDAYARINHIIKVNPAIIYSLKPQTQELGGYVIEFISPTAQQITGYTEEEWQTPGFWFQHIHPDDQMAAANASQNLINQGGRKHQYRFYCADGQYRWIEDHLRVNTNEAGEPIEIVGAWLDITDRKLAEQALSESEIKMAAILDNVGAYIFLKDTEGRYLYANKQVLTLWDKTLEDIIGFGDELFFDEQSAKQIRLNDCRVLVEGETIHQEETNLVTQTGKIATYWTCKLPLRNYEGHIYALCGISTDITQLKQLEQAFHEKEQLLSETQSIAHIGSWHINLVSGKLTWSDEAHRIYHRPLNDVEYTFETFIELLHPDDRSAMQVWTDQCLAGHSPTELQFRTILPDGTIKFLEGRGGLILDSETQLPIAMAGTVQDISNRKQMEMELQRWVDAFQYCAHGIAIGDHQTNQIATCNPAFSSMLGYASPMELQGKPILSVYIPSEKQTISNWIQEANDKGYVQYEAQMLRQNGSLIDVQMDLVSVKDIDNQVQYRVATMQDIGQRKRDQATLQLQSSALEAAANAIMITDQNGLIQWVNPAFSLLTGYPADEAVGRTPRELVNSGKQSHDIYEELWRTINNGNVWHGEIINRRKDGSNYIEEQVITPVFDDQQIIRHYIAVKQDISDRKQNEAELDSYRYHLEQLVHDRTIELDAARQEAERLSQVKSAFLANMSHEIRTPMNAVLGFCYLLGKRDLNEEARQLVQKIHSAGTSLLAIINDILDFSKIEAGRLEIELSPFHLPELVDQLSELMASFAHDKSLELIIMLSPGIDRLIGDGLRIQQVLLNLVSNAIKFTEQGEVELCIEGISETDAYIKLRFEVRDTGIGISTEKQRDIFSAFTQADTSISRRFGGTGLGLAICKQLVGLMGGELKVESVEGQGSRFWFELLLHRDIQAPTSKQHLHLNILMADDNILVREALTQIVASLGWVSDVVDSGSAAIKHFITHCETQKFYDVIILDWNMPEQDGFTTAQAIHGIVQSHATYKKALILIMATASARDELVAQPGIECVDKIIIKPVTASNLFNSIETLLKQREQGQPSEVHQYKLVNQQRIRHVRILVVDDSDINREVAQQILEADGATVSLANNGQEAMEWLQAHPNDVDIVLMDIQMPVMDGYTATKLIRQDPRLAQLPVIALTAGAFQSFRDEAYRAGMNDFVPKPFDVEQFMAVIQRYTRPPSSVSELERVEDESISNDSPTASITSVMLPDIDFSIGIKRWGDELIYKKYLNKFVESYADAGHTIEAYLKANDFTGASLLAHKLKGVAGNLALTSVMANAEKVYRLLTKSQLDQNAVASLQIAIDQVCRSIRQWNTQAFPMNYPSNEVEFPQNTTQIEALLNNLLEALDHNNPDLAEPILAQLKGKLDPADINQIQVQLVDFDFQAAIQATQELIHKLSSH